MIVDDRRGQTARVVTRGALAVGACVAVIAAGRALAETRPADEATPLVMFTHLHAVLLSIGLLALATAIGRAVLRRCGVAGASRIEHGVFSVAVGLGVIAFVVVFLGLAQPATGNYLVRTITGRVYVGHWSATVDYLQKRRDVAWFFAGPMDSERQEFLAAHGIRYVVVGPVERMTASPAWSSGEQAGLVSIYDADGVTIFEATQP